LESAKGNADALFVVSEPLVNTNRVKINALANAERLPTIYAEKGYVEAGGLMSYGPNYTNEFRRAADLVDKVLRGTKPGDIPVEEPTKFEFVINLTTAKALGLTIPASYLSLADELIE
jgi:putative ABC transport system substrate-binding protein